MAKYVGIRYVGTVGEFRHLLRMQPTSEAARRTRVEDRVNRVLDTRVGAAWHRYMGNCVDCGEPIPLGQDFCFWYSCASVRRIK